MCTQCHRRGRGGREHRCSDAGRVIRDLVSTVTTTRGKEGGREGGREGRREGEREREKAGGREGGGWEGERSCVKKEILTQVQ